MRGIFILACGKRDAQGTHYMTRADLEAMFLDSQLPKHYLLDGVYNGFVPETWWLWEACSAIVKCGKHGDGLKYPAFVQSNVLEAGQGSNVIVAKRFLQAMQANGFQLDADNPDPSVRTDASDGLLELIMEGDTKLPLLSSGPQWLVKDPPHPHNDKPLVGSQPWQFPVDQLYNLSMGRAASYGGKTAGKFGEHYVTLLHFAIYWERPNIVQELIDMGADPQVEDGWGNSCFEVANACPNKEVLAKVTKAFTASGGY